MIDTFLATELATERALGPVDPGLAGSIQVNRFGLVPKGHELDKWRLIVDLSFSRGEQCQRRHWPGVVRASLHISGCCLSESVGAGPGCSAGKI